MATRNTVTAGTPITIERMGRVGSKSLIDSPTMPHQQTAFALAAMGAPVATFDEYRVRLLAAGAPLWANLNDSELRAALRFMRTHPSTKWGTMHEFTQHGDSVACIGGHAGATDTCDAKAPRNRVGYLVVGPLANALGTDAAEIAKAANKALAGYVNTLRDAKFSDADIVATPSIAQLLAAGLRMPPARDKASTTRTPRAAKPAEVAPTE